MSHRYRDREKANASTNDHIPCSTKRRDMPSGESRQEPPIRSAAPDNIQLPLPAPPTPSADAGIIPTIVSPSKELGDPGIIPSCEDIDIFTLTPLAALRMLCRTAETLVSITGDIPPTPPVRSEIKPKPRVISVGSENVSHSRSSSIDRRRSTGPLHDTDKVPEKAKTPIGSPEAGVAESVHIISSNIEPLDVQRGIIARKFYSKKPPPIPLEEYLLRLHKYCPMSTAVYLATGLYIYRVAVREKIVPVTARNVHRLLLGALRVAMKALEDLSYPHKRFAKVGGVNEPELQRLEVSFCFLTNFELKVDTEMLLQHARNAADGVGLFMGESDFRLELPLVDGKKESKE
ncbi:MAG: hypothetical protein LQ342_004228 [Letrouitia transgressa]|nr:MAG: hypothetical protein LQ342_004228 [Letrouitia transgressa]